MRADPLAAHKSRRESCLKNVRLMPPLPRLVSAAGLIKSAYEVQCLRNGASRVTAAVGLNSSSDSSIDP